MRLRFSSSSRAERVRSSLDLFDLADLAVRPRGENEAVIRGLCQNAYIGKGSSLCRVLGRYKMVVDSSDLGLSSHLLLDGYWEMWVTEAIAATVKPGMTVVDVGANLGYFTLLLADLCGPDGRVHAFEPNPAIAARLRRSCDINGFRDRVVVHQTALGEDESATFRLIVPERYPSGAFLLPPDAPNPYEGAESGEGAEAPILINARRLDGFAEIANADVLKIDAEAAEQAIWHGMAGLFGQNRPMTIFLEFTACRYPDPALFLDEIAADGFALGIVSMRDGIRAVTKEEILALSPSEDHMLMLTRG